MLFGMYEHQVDSKGRLRLPAKFRAHFSSRYVITKGEGGCLYVFTYEKLEQLQDKLKNIPLGVHDAQNSIRAIFQYAAEIEEDTQGRFVLPTKLREELKIDKDSKKDKEVVILGLGDRAEIWPAELYKTIQSSISYDEALEKLAPYGV